MKRSEGQFGTYSETRNVNYEAFHCANSNAWRDSSGGLAVDDAADKLLLQFAQRAADVGNGARGVVDAMQALRLLAPTLTLVQPHHAPAVRTAAFMAVQGWAARFEDVADAVACDSNVLLTLVAAVDDPDVHEAVRISALAAITAVCGGGDGSDRCAAAMQAGVSRPALRVLDDARAPLSARCDAARLLALLAAAANEPGAEAASDELVASGAARITLRAMASHPSAAYAAATLDLSCRFVLASAQTFRALVETRDSARFACAAPRASGGHQCVPELVALLDAHLQDDALTELLHGVARLALEPALAQRALVAGGVVRAVAGVMGRCLPRRGAGGAVAGGPAREALEAAASGALANLCFGPNARGGQDALAACDGAALLVHRVDDHVGLGEAKRAPRGAAIAEPAPSTGALGATLLALTNATRGHDVNRQRAASCGAVLALVAALSCRKVDGDCIALALGALANILTPAEAAVDAGLARKLKDAAPEDVLLHAASRLPDDADARAALEKVCNALQRVPGATHNEQAKLHAVLRAATAATNAPATDVRPPTNVRRQSQLLAPPPGREALPRNPNYDAGRRPAQSYRVHRSTNLW
ncbi:hypothetical protein M885DRAFT_537580 [Pelagophyceae sp. CCMP2097]|nr:hypothetical protein M885DRAFT_537580 [Pelagophyceae sp. CCMP2097]